MRTVVLGVVVLVPMLALVGPAEAAPGDLDPTFNGGTVIGPEGGAYAVAVQPDGKVVAAGVSPTAIGGIGSDWRLARFTSTGQPDATFGSGGVASADRGVFDQIHAVTLQPDGKIVVAGGTYASGFIFTVARFTANGMLDATFGTGGVVTTVLKTESIARAVVVQADGKIVAAGMAGDSASRAFAVVRYTPTGLPDPTFSTDGAVTTDIAGGDGTGAYGLALVDGRIVASGCSDADAANLCSRYTLMRYDAAGQLDTGFDGDGIVVGPAGLRARGGVLAVQPAADPAQRKLVAAGDRSNPQIQTVARFHLDGSPDTSFGGGDGLVDTVAGTGAAVVARADGTVVVGGGSGAAPGSFQVVSYNADGTLDTGFDGDGKATTTFGPSGSDIGGLVAQPDGRLVAAGAGEARFVLARYEVAAGGGGVADLSVTATDAPDPVAAGGTLTYNLAVANAGPASAYRVVGTAVLPAGSGLVSARPSRGLCSESAGTVTCELNGLVAGASATVELVVNPGRGGQNTLAFSATTTSEDPPANNATSTTTRVTPGAGAWTSLPPLAAARSGPTTLLPDGRVMAVGGVVDAAATASAEIYDPSTGTTEPTGSLSAARRKHTATTLGGPACSGASPPAWCGKVLVAGGTIGSQFAKSAEIWDPATGTWSVTGSTAGNHSLHVAVRLNDGRVLVVGGTDLPNTICPGPSGVPNSAELYDPATGTWSPAGDMAVARVYHTATKLNDGRVLAVGGYIHPNYQTACGTPATNQLAPVEMYNPATNTWSTPADTAIRRTHHAAALLADGSVLVTGGDNCNATCPTTSVERFDPVAGTWSPRAPLPLARALHSATALPNGKVLVAAGRGPLEGSTTTYARSTSLYDPGSDTWSAAGVTAARLSPAELLANNRVLLVGGERGGGGQLSSVDVWAARPATADLDGDSDTDRAVYRSGAWYAEGQPTAFVGTATDVPVPADYDGDGDAEHAVYRDGAWYADGAPPAYFGTATDVPVPADYDGDGDADPAVYRPSVGGWYVVGQPTQFIGLSTDVPVPADYDGDGDVERAIWRPSVGGWYVEGAAAVFVGLSGDVPVPGDYDSDGDAERGIWRPNVGGWYVEGEPTVFLGLSGDVPLPLPHAVYRRFF